MERWIEVEPGTPLPDEVPPWAERYDLVRRAGLPDAYRRAASAAGVALLAGVAATVVFVGPGDTGPAFMYALVAGLVGLVLLYIGLIGVPPRERFVPSPGGRYVRPEAPPTPAALVLRERAEERKHRWVIARETGVAVVLGVLMLEYLRGDLTLDWIRTWGPMFAPMGVFMLPVIVDAVKRHMRSEAEVSERFLRAADARYPLTPGTGAPPAAAVDAVPPSADALRATVPDAALAERSSRHPGGIHTEPAA